MGQVRRYMRWLHRIMGVLLLAIVTTAVIIEAGLFDPRPHGTKKWQRSFAPQTIPAATSHITWLERPLPAAGYSLRLTAAYRSGETDIGYGLAIGGESQYLAIALSPAGYLAIWQESIHAAPSFIIPWQTWPHVRTGAAANEIWVDVEAGQATVRINREWLWQGEVGQLGSYAGLLGQSFGEEATVGRQTLQLFTQEDGLTAVK